MRGYGQRCWRFYAARGALQALRYPANLRASFPQASGN
jgi:hypothetical protein